MANNKSKADLLSSIAADLADNNAGLISATDVRSNMEDVTQSINGIVASGSTATTDAFVNNVKIKKSTSDGSTGILVVGSGVTFEAQGCTQTDCFPGEAGLTHNNLGGLTDGDPHIQYLPVAGNRKMEGNLGMDSYFINSSGSTVNQKGIGFKQGHDGEEEILVSGTMIFSDKSKMNTGLQAARAWATFDASVGVVAWSGYNVTAVSKSACTFSITFDSGVLHDNNYLAFGYSNGRSTADNNTDFDRCFVGMTARGGAGTQASQHTLSFAVLTESGVYATNSKQNHVVVFGLGSGVSTNNVNTGTIS